MYVCWLLLDISVNKLITSNHRPFSCPIFYVDTHSKCYFVHRHPNNACIAMEGYRTNEDAIRLLHSYNFVAQIQDHPRG